VYYHNSLKGEYPEQSTVLHRFTDLQAFSFMVDHAESEQLPGTTGVTGTMTVTAKSFTYSLTSMDLKKSVYKRRSFANLKLNTGRWLLDRPIDFSVEIHCLIVAEDTVAKLLVCLCVEPDGE
jgi:hypothetical protein